MISPLIEAYTLLSWLNDEILREHSLALTDTKNLRHHQYALMLLHKIETRVRYEQEKGDAYRRQWDVME